jgi:uncharacterized membrane protein
LKADEQWANSGNEVLLVVSDRKSPAKRGQNDCGDDHAVRCQNQSKASGLCVNPG